MLMPKDEWPKVLYIPRVIDAFIKRHPNDFNETELDLLHRLSEITYDGKFELYNDIPRWTKTFGNCNKWQVEDGDLKSYPFKATTLAVCSDYKTEKEAIESCKENNEEDSKKYKVMR